MDHFNYDADGQLQAEQLPLQQLADQYGTPLYVYSRATLERHWHAFDQAAGDIPHLICYAVKANSNLALLNLLARLGSGFDIVSGGELSRVLAAGGDPAKVVFSGVAKSEAEMRLALEKEILCFNLESEAELERLNRVAGSMGKKARVSVRVNPDIDAGTHPYISTGLKQNKFGIPIEQAPAIYRKAAAMAHIEIKGVDCHIGSQLTELNPFMEAADKLLKLIDELAADNLVMRRQGKGTFVATHNEEQVQYRFLQLHPDIGQQQDEGRAQRNIIECKRIRASADIARTLQLRTGDSVIHVRRILSFNNTPTILEDIWLPSPVFKGLNAEQMAHYPGPTYAMFEMEYGVRMVRAEEKIRAVLPDAQQAQWLNTTTATPVLSVERVTFTYNDKPMELRRGLYLTDSHHYRNALS